MGDACVAMANGGVCVNTDGTYGCGCEAGYVGDGTLAGTGCADIDECTLATDDCYADVCTNTVGAFTCTALFGTSPFQNLFVRLDVNTGAALSATALPATIGTITGVNGIAAHPVTGLVYGIAKVSGTAGRVLFTMDPGDARAHRDREPRRQLLVARVRGGRHALRRHGRRRHGVRDALHHRHRHGREDARTCARQRRRRRGHRLSRRRAALPLVGQRHRRDGVARPGRRLHDDHQHPHHRRPRG
jgi:hypothetical protein